MSTLMQQIIQRAKSDKQRIVLPESLEERTLTAADMALADDLADIILIGPRADIMALGQKLGLTHLDKATIIDPATSDKTEAYAQLLFQLRQKKGMTLELARKQVLDPLYFGCLIIKSGDADGQISGALSTTGDTLRPALQIIKCAPGISCVSGAMLIISERTQYGEGGVLVYGDVAVTPMPDASQLAQIAVCTAQTAKSVAGIAEPKVAMLSFSTKGRPSTKWWTRWWRLPVWPSSSIPRSMSTASFRPMQPLWPLWVRRRRPAARLPVTPTCSSSPTSNVATSATS